MIGKAGNMIGLQNYTCGGCSVISMKRTKTESSSRQLRCIQARLMEIRQWTYKPEYC